MIQFKAQNQNGVMGSYNLKTGQFIPDCCINCSRLSENKLENVQTALFCGICIFLPISSGTCKRQLKDQLKLSI